MKQFFLSFLAFVLKRAAQRYLRITKPLVIGITGSVGKTSCRLIIADILKKLLPQEYVYTSSKNYNSDIGLPLSILGVESYKPTIDGAITALFESLYQSFFIKSKPSILVLEYGIDKPGDMDVLLGIVAPDIAIYTALDLVHGENFPNGQEGIGNEKVKLLQAAKDLIFINTELKGSLPASLDGKTVVEFGEQEGVGQINFSDYQVSLSGNKITSSFRYKAGDNGLLVTSNITGMHNIAYMCIAITIADVISHRKQYPSLRAFQTLQLPISLQPGRFSLFTSTRGDVIIDSTYNAAPTSMRKVINEGIALQKEFFPQYGIICVLGEMRELGDASQQEHTKLGQWLADKVDMVVGVSGNSVYMTDYLIGLKDPTKHIYRIQTNLEVSDNVRHIMEVSIDKRYIIIFKSSQGEIRLEEAIKSFISQDLWGELPRQEPFWIIKKRFAKKLYEEKDHG